MGARRLPGDRLGRRLPHHRQGSPLLRQDHLVHRPLPLLRHVHPAWPRPHLARYIQQSFLSLETKLDFQERSTASGITCTWTGPSCWTARPGSMVRLKSSSPTALGWERFLLLEATTSFTTTVSGSITLSTFYQMCLGNFSLAAYSAG